MLSALNIRLVAQNKTSQFDQTLFTIDSLITLKEFDKAQQIIDQNFQFSSSSDDTENRLDLNFRAIQILNERGGSEAALEKVLVGLEKAKIIDSPQLYIKHASYLALLLNNSQSYKKAIYYNRLALKKARSIQDTLNTIKLLVRVGSYHFAEEKIDSARYYFINAINYPANKKYIKDKANAFNNLSVITLYEGNYALAEKYAEKSLKITKKQNDVIGTAYAKANIGNVYLYQNKYKTAVTNYLESLQNVIENDSKKAILIKNTLYDNLFVAYDSLGDYTNAYKYILKSYDAYEKIVDDDLTKTMDEIAAKYNLALEKQKTEEEKNKALKIKGWIYVLAIALSILLISFLIYSKTINLRNQKKQNLLRSQLQNRIINATIDAKEKERRVIASILHDSVSALLSSANLHLKAAKTQLKGDIPVEIGKAEVILIESSTKIRDLSHELISAILLKFGLTMAVQDICEKYSNSKLEFFSKAKNVKRYNQKFEIKIFSIIEELINNILKHSKAASGMISLSDTGNKLTVHIMDDGIGFDVKEGKGKAGLGLSHIDARIQGMGGVFNINSKKGEGTSVLISVPIHEKKES